MNTESDRYQGLEQESQTGPMKSVEGYILAITGLHGEVFCAFFTLLGARRRYS